jgi:transketolase
MVMTRQNVPVFDRSKYASAEGVQRGGYVLADPEDGDPELILIATGSEVQLALGAHERLEGEGIPSRVVSLPCWEIFEKQDRSYRDEVLPPGVTARLAIEEASPLGWEKWTGSEGAIMGMTTFGQSAPFADVEAEFGFTVDNVTKVAREVAQGAAAKSTT